MTHLDSGPRCCGLVWSCSICHSTCCNASAEAPWAPYRFFPHPLPPSPPLVQDSNYLDRHTRRLTAELLVFSRELRVFAHCLLSFAWNSDGSVALTPSLVGLPALTYLQPGQAAWGPVSSRELVGLWVLTFVFVAVVVAQVRTGTGSWDSTARANAQNGNPLLTDSSAAPLSGRRVEHWAISSLQARNLLIFPAELAGIYARQLTPAGARLLRFCRPWAWRRRPSAATSRCGRSGTSSGGCWWT